MDRESAQTRLNRIRTFSSELALLERDGIVVLEPEQQLAIDRHHQRLVADLTSQFDLDDGDTQRRMSLGMRIAAVMGAIALSAAVFLLFYRVWGALTTTLQVAILTTAPLAAVALTEIAQRFDRSRHLVFIAAVIACAAIVMNVMLVGDIFAMTDSPNALAVWSAFALLIGYGYGLRLPVAVGFALAIAFAAGTTLAWRGIEWKEFVLRPELLLPFSGVVFAAGSTRAARIPQRFAPTFRMVGLAVLLGALWVLSIDGHLSALVWSETRVKAVYQVLGFITAGLAIAAGLRRSWNDAANIGAVAFVVFLYTKFFQWWWDWMPAYLFFFIVGAVAIAIILVLRRVRTSFAGGSAA